MNCHSLNCHLACNEKRIFLAKFDFLWPCFPQAFTTKWELSFHFAVKCAFEVVNHNCMWTSMDRAVGEISDLFLSERGLYSLLLTGTRAPTFFRVRNIFSTPSPFLPSWQTECHIQQTSYQNVVLLAWLSPSASSYHIPWPERCCTGCQQTLLCLFFAELFCSVQPPVIQGLQCVWSPVHQHRFDSDINNTVLVNKMTILSTFIIELRSLSGPCKWALCGGFRGQRAKRSEPLIHNLRFIGSKKISKHVD